MNNKILKKWNSLKEICSKYKGSLELTCDEWLSLKLGIELLLDSSFDNDSIANDLQDTLKNILNKIDNIKL